MNWQLDVNPKPALLALPPAAVSLDEAHAAIELWEYYSGKALDPTQRLAVEIMMAESADGRWAARTTGREMPRQNGKGDEIEVVELWGLTQRNEAILHTAHELATVAGAHERMVALLRHPDLQRKIERTLNGVGQQAIHMVDGGVIAYRTRTGGGGRGLDDISRLVVDEAQHARKAHLASASPTLLANPNPQLNAIGTGGIAEQSTEFSDWWWAIRKRALVGGEPSFGYLGHSAEAVTLSDDGEIEQHAIDPTDESLWFEANPVLSTERGDIEFFREQFRTLGPDLFAREHLGVWDSPRAGAAAKPKIDPHWWRSCADRKGEVAGKVVVAVDTTFDLDRSALIVVGRQDDARRRIEVVQQDQGSHWLEIALLDVLEAQRVMAITFDASGPAKSLRPMIERVVAEHNAAHPEDDDVKIAALPLGRYQAACAQLVADAKVAAIAHDGNTSLAGLATTTPERKIGDGWIWDRRVGDICLLVASTCGSAVADSLPEIEKSTPVRISMVIGG